MMESRPWGEFHILHDGVDCKIKRLVVNPLKRLSLQSHVHRREVWIVLRGQGKAVKGDATVPLSVGTLVVIEKEEKHRLINDQESGTLELIEVQTGEYFGEEDIVRYEDDFQRL
jgi:mannose-6-phosphate isomerase-like protein (cupin superfamily)